MAEIPTADWSRINDAADRFEHAWRVGPRPRIEDYLAEAEPDLQTALLEELLRVERELRRREGENPGPDEYALRFSRHAGLIQAVFGPEPDPSGTEGQQLALTIATGCQRGGDSDLAPGAFVRYFGDYEIRAEIGRGGMGVVYKAQQISLNRLVALEMILAGQLADAGDIKRFYTEAEAAAQLDHPGIVPIYEVGQHDSQHFFSMAYVEGRSLAQRLAEGPMPAREAAALLREVARAIEYSHQRGVIHSDLKPANILLDAQGRPRVTDFGLARRVRADGGLTASGQVMGTPSYMPPEQARGKRAEIGPAADVYALGATLYCMVTGRPPFQAATAMETVLQVIGEEPVPPRRLIASIPRDLETIRLRCLEKEPGRRYATASSLAEDLRRYLVGEPILARPVTRLERAVKWARRRPAIAMLSGLVGLVAALGLVGVLWQWRVAVAQSQLAKQRLEDALEARAKERVQTELAERESQRAKAQAELAEQRLYDVRMNFVQRNWEDYHGALVGQMLDEQLPAKQGGVDRRGFEWFFWRRKTLSGQVTLKGHPDDPFPFMSAALSRDGRRMIGGGRDGSVKVWDASTGAPTLTLKGHTGRITSVVFSPDGRRLASGTRDGAVKVWDTETGQEIRTLNGRTISVISLAFSPDGSRLTSACAEWTVKAWDATTAQETLTIQAPTIGMPRLAFDLDSTQLACAGTDGSVKFWDFATGREIRSLQGHTVRGSSVAAFSPDGRRVASAGSDDSVQVWDVSAWRELLSLSRHAAHVSCLEFSPDGGRLASAGGDKTVKVWDAATGQEIRTLNPRRDMYVPLGLAFSPDGKRLAASGSTGTLEVWDAATGREVFIVTAHRGTAGCVAFSPDGQHLVTASWDRTVKVWDAATAKEIRTLNGHTDAVLWVTFSPDGRRIASGSHDGEVKVWDALTGQETPTLKEHTSSVTGVAFSRDGHRLASASVDGTMKVWDARPLEDDPAKPGQLLH